MSHEALGNVTVADFGRARPTELKDFDNQKPASILHAEFGRERYITPEGFDVLIPEQAEQYLREVHGREWGPIESIDDVFALLKQEERAALYADGHAENVYEHTQDLVQICREEAAKHPGRYDVRLVELFAWAHDLPEALGGDTIIMDPKAEESRFLREEAAVTLLNTWLPDNPVVKAMNLYRECEENLDQLAASPENAMLLSSFALVKSCDKVQAYEFQLRDDVQAKLHRDRQEDYVEIVEKALPKVLHDEAALKRMIQTLTTLGHNWISWGCKPFMGDPMSIVNLSAHRAEMKYKADPTEQNFTGQTVSEPNIYLFSEHVAEKAARMADKNKKKELARHISKEVLAVVVENGRMHQVLPTQEMLDAYGHSNVSLLPVAEIQVPQPPSTPSPQPHALRLVS